MINIPQNVKDLQPYKPGKPIEEVQKELGLDKVYKIASNENPLGPSPKAIEAMKRSMDNLHRYPDIGAIDLRQKIAEKFNTKLQNVIAGSGSEGVMAVAVRSMMFRDENIVTSDGTFIGLYVIANAAGVELIKTPMKDYRYDVNAIADAINDKTKIVYVANPNNPTGTIISKEEFDYLYSKVPENVLLVMDEAYVEYAEDDPNYPISININKPNVLTTRTFSKAYGISGIRVGFGISDPYIISHMIKVKLPFEPSLTAQYGALGALDDNEFISKSKALNSKGKELFYQVFDELGIEYVKSHGNFVFTIWDNEDRVNRLNQDLMKEGVIIRPLRPFGFPNCMRVTVGTEEENAVFIDALKKVL